MEQVECTKCGHIVNNANLQRVCPNCNAVLPRPGAVAPAPQPVASAEVAAVPIVPLPPKAPGEIFPERMRANKALAGRKCTACEKEIDIGDEVWNCQVCQTSMHQGCRDQHNGCANIGCPAFPKAAAPGVAKKAGAGATGDTVECVGCGELILKKSRKCRFCGEYQSPVERARIERMANEGGADDDLTGAEIAFGIICGLIACIVGIYWMIQGKKKGGKLVLIAFISQMVFGMLRAMAN